MEFTITLERFQGPYTTLLSMIEERKLSITEISLAQITDDYIAFVEQLPKKDFVDISAFVVVASTLMLIKVKSLLPGIAYTEQEEKQIHDLEEKLLLHQSLRAGMKLIENTFGKTTLATRSRAKLQHAVFTPSNQITKEVLHSIAHLMKAAFEKVERVKQLAITQTVRLEDVIESIRQKINQGMSMTLSQLSGGATTFEQKKKTLIVSFLALLELVKSGSISAEEEDGDIRIRAY